MTTIGRVAPTPSGRMHLGNAFTALLAWLSARSQGGRIVLRIEDLDPARCRPAYARQLREDLTWLGLDWDQEMPPQSARSAVYAEYFDQLDRRGLLYPCYCSRGQLHAASAPHASDGRVIYAGACRDLTPAQRAEIHKAPAWRIRVPDETIPFSDRVFGPTAQNLQKECGDFILRRADGVYAYQLAVVCDDALAGVTEVVRGCDLLPATPPQLYLMRLLGFPAPRYAHVPLLTDETGRRLSKRDGDLDFAALRQRWRAPQLTGYLACAAGLLPAPEPVTPAELIAEFDWQRIPRRPAIAIRALLSSS